MGVATGIAIGGLALAAGASYMASREQKQAANDAAKKQRAQADKDYERFKAQSALATDSLRTGYDQGMRYMGEGYNRSLGAISSGAEFAQRELGRGRDATLASLNAGYDSSNAAINRGVDAASGQLQQGYGAAQKQLGGLAELSRYGDVAGQFAQGGGRLGALLSGDLSRENAYAGFAADPGYQFRQQQGEQALNRATAAQGGRAGGRALKELTNYNSDLASQEYGNFAARRQALNALQMQGAQSADAQQLGAAMNLANVGYGAQSQMAGMSADLGGRLSGLTMAGAGQVSANEAARGTAAAGYQNQYGTNMANLQSTLGQQQASLAGDYFNNLANNRVGLGSGVANVQMGVGSAAMQAGQSKMPTYAAAVPYAGAGWQAAGQFLGGLGSLGLMYGMSQGGGGGQPGGGYSPEQWAWADYGNAYYRPTPRP